MRLAIRGDFPPRALRSREKRPDAARCGLNAGAQRLLRRPETPRGPTMRPSRTNPRRWHPKAAAGARTKRFTSCYSAGLPPELPSKPLKRWLHAALACCDGTRQVELSDKWTHCAPPTDFHLLA